MEKLKFVALQSIVEPGFWNRMTKLKLDEWKLQEDEQPVNWSYEISKNFIRFEHDSLAFDKSKPNGFIKNFNTLDNYKQFDKKKALENKLSAIRAKIEDGSWTTNDLFQPLLICFADLKKYHYYYWMCFPTFKLNCSFGFESESPNEKLISRLINLELIKTNKVCLFSNDEAFPLEEIKKISKEDFCEKFKIILPDHAPSDTQKGVIGNLARNVLYLLWKIYGACTITIITLRKTVTEGVENYSSSQQFKIQLVTDGVEESQAGTGWEISKGKPATKKIDLSASMDPNCLASNAVDLNLKLMKWRLQE